MNGFKRNTESKSLGTQGLTQISLLYTIDHICVWDSPIKCLHKHSHFH